MPDDKTYRTEEIMAKTKLSKSGLRWRRKTLGIRPAKKWVTEDNYYLTWTQDDLDRLMEYGKALEERNSGK